MMGQEEAALTEKQSPLREEVGLHEWMNEASDFTSGGCLFHVYS